ncbi:MAG TPA: Ig-like domain-containing protein [Kofleriaceae bacterium]|nr:Ig-like domain-containing protein [Kofleriaceae bacterium]
MRISSAGITLVSLLTVAAPAAAEDQAPRVDPLRVELRDSPCPGPMCRAQLQQPFAQGRRVVYLMFDGITLSRDAYDDDARTNTSAIVNTASEVIPAFSPSALASTGGLSRQQIIDKVIDDLYALHAPYNVDFVTSRPSSGNYSMIVFGGTCQSVTGSSNCAGIALLDCGDQMPANITFVFPAGLRVADLATTAAQEAAHAYGLGHTDDHGDVMYPQILSSIPSHFGAGNIPDASGCPSSATYQNSDSKMMTTIGPRGQDVVSPIVTITSPADGATIGGGTVLTADISDDISVDRATLEIDGDPFGEPLADPPWRWGLPLLSAGSHLLTVRAWDVSDNSAADNAQVTFSNGSAPCDGPEDCETWQMCIEGQCRGSGDGGLGDPCSQAPECDSGLCATSGDTSLCTQVCDTASPCPDGFGCESGVCWPATGGGDGGGGGCAAGRGGTAIGGLLLLALVLLRRRR